MKCQTHIYLISASKLTEYFYHDDGDKMEFSGKREQIIVLEARGRGGGGGTVAAGVQDFAKAGKGVPAERKKEATRPVIGLIPVTRLICLQRRLQRYRERRIYWELRHHICACRTF